VSLSGLGPRIVGRDRVSRMKRTAIDLARHSARAYPGETGTARVIRACPCSALGPFIDKELGRTQLCHACAGTDWRTESFGCGCAGGLFSARDGARCFWTRSGACPLSSGQASWRATETGQIQPLGSEEISKPMCGSHRGTNEDFADGGRSGNLPGLTSCSPEYLLSVLAALRHRGEESWLLFEVFRGRRCPDLTRSNERYGDDAAALLAYDWPGKGRSNCASVAERRVLRARGGGSVAKPWRVDEGGDDVCLQTCAKPWRSFERHVIARLSQHVGRMDAGPKALGIGRRT